MTRRAMEGFLGRSGTKGRRVVWITSLLEWVAEAGIQLHQLSSREANSVNAPWSVSELLQQDGQSRRFAVMGDMVKLLNGVGVWASNIGLDLLHYRSVTKQPSPFSH